MTSDEMKLRIIPTSEGYFDALRKRYFYNYTDHLGNVRVSYSDADGNNEVTGDIVVNNCVDTPDGQMCNNYIITGEAEGVTNYYPFGMMHTIEYNTFDNAYLYKYNGKELQETGMYDYGARFYMPDLGRWGVVDPLAESSRRFTPYHYGNNNPIRFIDPDGRSTQTFTGGDIQNAFYQFYFSGSVSKVTGGNSFGSSGGDNAPMFYNDEAGMMMTSALGNDGQGGGGSLTFGKTQAYRDIMDYLAQPDYFAGIDFSQFGADDGEDSPIMQILKANSPVGLFGTDPESLFINSIGGNYVTGVNNIHDTFYYLDNTGVGKASFTTVRTLYMSVSKRQAINPQAAQNIFAKAIDAGLDALSLKVKLQDGIFSQHEMDILLKNTIDLNLRFEKGSSNFQAPFGGAKRFMYSNWRGSWF